MLIVRVRGVVTSIGLATKLTRSGDILHAHVSTEEAVMMSVEAGRYYGLNAVASRIWELLSSPKTVAELCAHICEEFEVDEQTCENEILKFAHTLINHGIVHAVAG